MSFRNSLMIAAFALAAPLAAPLALAAEEAANRSVQPVLASEPTVDLGELIGKVAKKSGRTFLLDPRVAGRVSITGLDVARVDYRMLQAILRLHGFAAIEQGDAVNVVPDANVRQFPVPNLSGNSAKIGADELVTQVVQVRNIEAAQLVPVLRPLMPQYAHLAAYPPTNTLIVMDRAANVQRIVGLIESLDKPGVRARSDGAAVKPDVSEKR